MKLPEIILQDYEEYKNFNIDEVLKGEYKEGFAVKANLPKVNIFSDYFVINIINGVPSFQDEITGVTIEDVKNLAPSTENPFRNLGYKYSKESFEIKFLQSPDKPILINNFYTVENSFITSNIRFLIEKQTKVDFLEVNSSKNSYFSINNRDFNINSGDCNYSRVDIENNRSNIVYNYLVNVQGGTFNSVSLNKTGNVNINNWIANLDLENSEANIYGIVELNGKSRHGSVCVINHNCKNTKSIQEFKHVLDENSYALYHGDTVIVSGAIDSNADQNSKTIMLSDNARILNKPRLNVYTGEVKATHGASVGRFNSEDIFYFRQRGFSEKLIKEMLVKAFVNDVIDRISSELIRGYIYDQR